MKLFITNIILFFTVLFLPIIICNILFIIKIREFDTLRPECRVVVLGHSHHGKGVNDELYPIFENRASDGEKYYFNYHKLKRFTRNNKNNIEAITLTYSITNHSKIESEDYFIGNNKDSWINDYLPIYRDYRNLPNRFNLPVDGSEFHLMRRAYLSNYRFKPMYNRDMKNRYKGYFNKVERTISEAPKDYLDNRFNFYEIDKAESDLNAYVSTIQLDILCKIAQFAKDNNLQLFLVNTPLHYKFRERIPANLAVYHNEIAQKLTKEYGAIYLDYHTMEMADSCFSDHNHLNINGANIFTPRLLEDVTINMQRLGKW